MPTPQGPVKSLYQLSKNVLLKLVDTIDDVGDIDYALVRPILLKITSPTQLKKLEQNSPQVAQESSEIWLKLITRDFGAAAADKYIPSTPTSWSKIYDKHYREAAAASAAASATLRDKMSVLSNAKASQRARIITNTSGLPPTQRRTGSGWGRSADSWTTKAGSKTKNIVQKARREAKEVNRFLGRNSKLAAPTHTLRRAEVSRTMKEKIKDPIVAPEKIEESRKRPAVVVDDDEEEEERGRMDDRTAKWISGGGAKRVAVGKLNRQPSGSVGGPVGGVMKVRAEADPFMRRKQVVRR